MNKLTKEQAECLLNCFSRKSSGISELTPIEIKSIINQCTEKEFPEFTIENCGNLIKAIYNLTTNEHICIEIIDGRHPSAFESIGLTFKQFKQFTEGCNKIVEWLEGQ